MTEEQEISSKISYVRTPDITDADRDLGFGEKLKEEFRRTATEILILLGAIDETFSQTVYTRSSYKSDEVKFGHKFASL